MPITIERDVKREQVWARVGLIGPGGSGKSRGSFELASRLFDGTLPITLINTEANRGKLYADRFKIDALIEVLDDHHPERFIEAWDAAEQITPGGVVILDSATHEWYGTNGVTQLASRFGDWAKARPLHQKFVDRMNSMQCHVIVCTRAKMKYEQVEVEQANGSKKVSVVALGVGPMQDADFQYEFSLVGNFDRTTHLVEWTGHVDSLEGQSGNLVEDGDEIAGKLTAWLSEGAAMEPILAATEEEIAELRAVLLEEGHSLVKIEQRFAERRAQNRGQLHPEYVAEALAAAHERLATVATDEGLPDEGIQFGEPKP